MNWKILYKVMRSKIMVEKVSSELCIRSPLLKINENREYIEEKIPLLNITIKK